MGILLLLLLLLLLYYYYIIIILLLLFLRFGLLSTLIRHENGAFGKTLFKPEEFGTSPLYFRMEGNHFENGAFRKRCSLCPSFPQTQYERKTFDAFSE